MGFDYVQVFGIDGCGLILPIRHLLPSHLLTALPRDSTRGQRVFYDRADRRRAGKL